MSAPLSPAILEAARAAQRSAADSESWHIVMHREGDPPAKGERLATLTLPPAIVARVGAEELAKSGQLSTSDADKLHVGRRVIRAALDPDRRRWVRAIMRAGYVDGWGVAVVHERGFVRSIFPGAGLGAARDRRIAVVRSTDAG